MSEIPFANRRITWIGEPEAHDAWACLIASIAGSVAVLDDCLAIYRRHETNASEAIEFVPKNLRERIHAKLWENSARYEEQAELYRNIANYLDDRGSSCLSTEHRSQFLSASKHINGLGERLTTRARINRASHLGKRLQAYASLIRSGAYSRKQHGGFGPAEATVDLVRAILPRF